MGMIRDAGPGDEGVWRVLWAQYLEFYAVALAPGVTAQTWARVLDPESPLGARMAVRQGEVVGFAMHHLHLSTWSKGPDCYLEDLFVTPTARGEGLGRALIEDLRAVAVAKGCSRLYWHTDAANSRARALYDSFVPSDGHIRYRIVLPG